jgi:aspartate/methionine/tyrosine aminotransferase
MSAPFHENDYLSWYVPLVRGHGEAINLHASGAPAVPPSALELPAETDPFESVRRFEEGLASLVGIPPRELLFTPGATGGTLLALLTFGRPGSAVVVERPIYEPMLRQAARLGPVRRLERGMEDGWRIPLDLARELVGDDTSVVMITEPHNPSGVLAPRAGVLELASIAAKRGAVLLVNEVYRMYTDAPSYHGLADNIVVVSSLSKLLGAYWARLGWLSAPAPVIEKLRRGHWNMGMPTTPGARAGLGFLEKAPELIAASRAALGAGVDAVDRWVAGTEGLSWTRPDGAGFGCVALPPWIDDVAFAERLHARRGVLLIPGSRFERPGTVRISWLQSGERLAEGLGIVADFLRISGT